MAATDYVSLTISTAAPGLQQANFGTGLLLSYVAAWAENNRTYNGYAAVLTDFPNATGPEARFAAAYFGQSPSPAALIIGKGLLPATKIIQLSAVAPTAALLYPYKVLVQGDGFADATVTYTSDGTPTDAEYAAGMVTALNAVSGKNFTAAGSSSPITITGNAAGSWFAITPLDTGHQTIIETTTDPGIATDLTAITNSNPNWYTLHTSYNSKACLHAGAAWVEANPARQYFQDIADTVSITVTSGNSDAMDDAHVNSYTRTSAHYHPQSSVFMGGALAGRCLPFNPGGINFAFRTLAGVPTYSLTGTNRANIRAKNGNGYEVVYGIPITFLGQCGGGLYIDQKRNLDWIQATMGRMIFGALAAANILPYTDPGIAIIGAQVRGCLKLAADLGIVIRSTINVIVPVRANVVAGDIASRTLNGVSFSCTAQGAIDTVNVIGSVV